MLILALAALIATVPVKLLAGEMIYSKIFKKEAGKMIYYLTGAVIFAIVYEIPFLGGLIKFIALLVGLGDTRDLDFKEGQAGKLNFGQIRQKGS